MPSRTVLRRLAPPLFALLGAGCGVDAGTPVSKDLPPLEIIPAAYLRDTLAFVELHDGDRVDLEFPPQGGFVLFAGARVRHLGERSVEVRGRLRDATGAVVGEDARTASFQPTPGDPDLFEPDLRSYVNVANIPVCPARGKDLYDRPFTLELTLRAPTSGRSGTAVRTVTPSCRQAESATLALCRCECAAGYQPGSCK